MAFSCNIKKKTMIGFVVPCSFENRKNIIEICNFFSNIKEAFVCLIANNDLRNFLNENIKIQNNIIIIESNSNNVSLKRNIGIEFFLDKSLINWISFLDSDCFVDFNNFTKIKNHLVSNDEVDINLVNLISKNNKRIGNKLRNLKVFNFINLYKAGTPSIIIKKKSIKNLFDIRFGIGTSYYSAEDSKFLIDNFSRSIKVIEKTFIFHPDEEININKISNYSFGQNRLIKQLDFPHSFLFFIIIIYRPILGLFYSSFRLDIFLAKIYYKRIKILLNV